MLSKLRYFNDQCGLEYSKFDHSSTSKTIFIKVRNKFNNIDPKKVQFVIHAMKVYVKNNSHVYKNKYLLKPTYFYCNTKNHTHNSCYIRNFDAPNGKYVWVMKGTNQ